MLLLQVQICTPLRAPMQEQQGDAAEDEEWETDDGGVGGDGDCRADRLNDLRRKFADVEVRNARAAAPHLPGLARGQR